MIVEAVRVLLMMKIMRIVTTDVVVIVTINYRWNTMYRMDRNVDVVSRYSSFEIKIHHLPQSYHITIHITIISISISIHTNNNTNNNTNTNIGMNREKSWLESWSYVVVLGLLRRVESGNGNDDDGIGKEAFL